MKTINNASVSSHVLALALCPSLNLVSSRVVRTYWMYDLNFMLHVGTAVLQYNFRNGGIINVFLTIELYSVVYLA